MTRLVVVALHDVAPATWPECERLIDLVRTQAPQVPLTLLVVPDYHGRGGLERATGMRRTLDARLARGDEVALHGWRHLDDAPPPGTFGDWFDRRVLTNREGEFAALEDADARQRIDQGLAALARVGWTPRGFVPPAWLLPRGGIGPLQGFGFEYTTIRRAMIRLDDGWWWRSPAVSLSSRTWLDRSASRFAASRLVRMFDGTRVLRLALHPVDARHPASLRTWGRILPAVLAQREPVTKGDATLALAAATGAERSGCVA